MITTKQRKIRKPKDFEAVRLGRNITRFMLIIIIFTVIHPCAAAQQPDQLFDSLSDIDPESPWQIEANEIFYDDKSSRYIAKGSVTLTKNDKKLSADYISFDYKNMKAYAKGNVSMVAGKDTLAGSSMDIDLEKQTGTIENGT
ncbi:MAG: hypothetical protein QNK40_04935, partial [Desulfobacterales bacterium]|nr:hypothetical protein [Desulfobacterales bacterium]MDX2508651.1 hypothetical protein [Desulfobacterales bacterium]